MKATCIISHTMPLGDGRFRAYAQGVVYDIDDSDAGLYFKPLEAPDAIVTAGNDKQADAEQAAEE